MLPPFNMSKLLKKMEKNNATKMAKIKIFFPILGQKLYFFLPKFREHYDKMHCLCKLMVLELYNVQKRADNDVILVHDVVLSGVLE